MCGHVDADVLQARYSVLPRWNVWRAVLFWAVTSCAREALRYLQPEAILLIKDSLSLLASVLQRLLNDRLSGDRPGHVRISDSSSGAWLTIKWTRISILPTRL